jgi:alpha-ketoglutarate-dependent taurine dioxygenase
MHFIRASASIRQLSLLSYQASYSVARNFTIAACRADTTQPISQEITTRHDSLAPIRKRLGGANGITIETTGNKANVWLGDNELYLLEHQRTLKLPYAYLRDACLCPLCKDPHSKQRSFRTGDIPNNIRPTWVKWNGKELSIKWDNDIPGYTPDHISVWTRAYLKNPIVDTHDQNGFPKDGPLFWGQSKMNRLQHWVSFEDYVNDDHAFTASMQNLKRLGLIFVKDVPEFREMVEQIATRMGPLRNTFYGSTFDVRNVPKAKNVAYTNQFLGFHMDLMYMNEPPGYQLLHCLENSCSGGESLFGDSFRAAAKMKKYTPRQYQVLSEHRLGYEYNHEGHIYHNKRPVFEVDPETKRLLHVNYSPPFQSSIPSPAGKDHDAGFVEEIVGALKTFTTHIDSEEATFETKLAPGTCVIFDNRRIVHARRQFDASEGSRWLAGAYVDTDALLSRFAVCKRNHRETWESSKPASNKPTSSETVDLPKVWEVENDS